MKSVSHWGMHKKNKYGETRTTVDGISFHSAKESRRYRELKILEAAGEIRQLLLQPRFKIKIDGQLVCTYVGDFQYTTKEGKYITEDVKGMDTPLSKLKRKLLLITQGIDVVII